MHNAPLLMRGGREHAARIHPDDAAAAGVEDGGRCRIGSAHGEIELSARSPTRSPGHDRRSARLGPQRRLARRRTRPGGANVNQLASSEPEDLERLAGMAFLNGIPVRLEAVAEVGREARAEPIAAGAPAS